VLTEQWGRLERMSASPGSARKLLELLIDLDVRDVLPSIRRPTLVIARRGDPVTRRASLRAMADMIPGSKYVELKGREHFPFFGDVESLLGEVQQFLTGTRKPPEPERLLATVLFVDIVDSTRLASRMGDLAWRDVLQRFSEMAVRIVTEHRGVFVKSTGDGFLARFDGPARGVRSAMALRESVRALDLELRAGLHTGECEMLPDDLGGIAVHIAARVSSVAKPGEILVSRTIKDLVTGSGLCFTDCGDYNLKGIEEAWQLFRVDG
jgi:class 3 adenylate cyclase